LTHVAHWSLATALAILAWYVFAPQCASTLVVVQRETNSWRWPLVLFAYMIAPPTAPLLSSTMRPAHSGDEAMVQALVTFLVVVLAAVWGCGQALRQLGHGTRPRSVV
jgi:hypothetical protein